MAESGEQYNTGDEADNEKVFSGEFLPDFSFYTYVDRQCADSLRRQSLEPFVTNPTVVQYGNDFIDARAASENASNYEIGARRYGLSVPLSPERPMEEYSLIQLTVDPENTYTARHKPNLPIDVLAWEEAVQWLYDRYPALGEERVLEAVLCSPNTPLLLDPEESSIDWLPEWLQNELLNYFEQPITDYLATWQTLAEYVRSPDQGEWEVIVSSAGLHSVEIPETL